MKIKLLAVAVAGLVLFGGVAKAALIFRAQLSTAGIHQVEK